MMRDVYKEHGRSRTFGDKSKGGLFSSFLKEYKNHFGVSVTPGCGTCLSKYWNNYTNLFTMNKIKVDCDFKLKKKYNGIQIGANGQPIRNGEMTNEKALELMEWHPLHEGLFDEVPDVELIADIDIKDDIKPANELSLTELRIRYPEITARSVESFLNKLAELN